MGNKRMFSKAIISTDSFLEMPLTSQALYFHMGMETDDEGFVASPRRIQRSVGAADDDFKLLITKGYIIPFESGVIVVTHWNVHNTIRKDRRKDTVCQEEKRQLGVDEAGSYYIKRPTDGQVSTMCQPTDGQVVAQLNKLTNKVKSIPPSREEVQQYISEKGYHVDADTWFDFYESNGWMIGKGKMKDWKAAVRTWENREKQKCEEAHAVFKELG